MHIFLSLSIRSRTCTSNVFCSCHALLRARNIAAANFEKAIGAAFVFVGRNVANFAQKIFKFCIEREQRRQVADERKEFFKLQVAIDFKLLIGNIKALANTNFSSPSIASITPGSSRFSSRAHIAWATRRKSLYSSVRLKMARFFCLYSQQKLRSKKCKPFANIMRFFSLFIFHVRHTLAEMSV